VKRSYTSVDFSSRVATVIASCSTRVPQQKNYVCLWHSPTYFVFWYEYFISQHCLKKTSL